MEKSFRMTVKEEEPEAKERTILLDQLHVYLTERRYVIKVLTALYRAAVSGAEDNVWRDVGKQVVEEAILKKGGMLVNVVGGIQTRWLAGKNDTPTWANDPLLAGNKEKVLWAWEKQVNSHAGRYETKANDSRHFWKLFTFSNYFSLCCIDRPKR